MTATHITLAPAEVRRLEALRRLDVLNTPQQASLDEAMRLVLDLAGAAVASLTFVREDSAWTKATTSPTGQMEVARERSPAAGACAAADGHVVLTIGPGEELADHPGLAGMALPVTFAAVVVHAPDGARVGALEVVWPGCHDIDPTLLAKLQRFAMHLDRVLELRAEVGEYRRFIELSPDPVIVLDLEGTIEQANPALGRLLGYEHADDLAGRAFLELVDRGDRARATAELARVLFARRRTVQLDLCLIDVRGRSMPCSLSAGHLRGARRQLQLVLHDLSDRLRDEDERSRLSEQLARAQRLDAVGQIAGGLAHDLNNLLVVMVSNLSLADESLVDVSAMVGDDVTDSLRQDLAELRLAVDRAAGLTSKLLSFARREDGEHGTSRVADTVETVQGLVARTLGRRTELQVALAEGLPPIAADPVQLERVLVNLVINARDAIEDGGTIRIEAESVTLSRDVLDRRGAFPVSLPGRECVRISVIDDGCGMDAATRARAFEPLFTTKGELGSGLGLATVVAFVDEVDGAVDVQSAPGEGTRITLTIPVTARSVEDVSVGLDLPVAGARVLLVDPGERTRRVIARMLQRAGYRVRVVGSAEEAMAALTEGGFELLVTDLSLSGATGPRLLEFAREANPAIRAIALTSVDAPRVIGDTPVLVKPFSHTRLLRTVERVMRDR